MKDLTHGSVAKSIFIFAIPLLLGNVFQQLYQTVDSIIVGNFIGKQALAAVGASFPILFLLIALMMGIGMGGTVLVSQYFGAKDIEHVKQAIDTTFIVLFWGAVFLSITGILLSRPILILLQTPSDVLPLAQTYLRIIFGGLILLAGYNTIGAVLRGLGDSKTPLAFLIIATLTNIGLDLLFVLVFKWGVAGAAFATVTAQSLAFFIGIIYLNTRHKIFKIIPWKMHFHRKIFKKSLTIGLPAGVQQVFVAISMSAIVGLVNTFGTNAIAGYAAASRIDAFSVMPAMMFAMALSTFVGQNLGAGNTERVKQGYRATLAMSSIVSVIVSVLVVIFRASLINLFNHDPHVIAIGSQYLLIIGSSYIAFNTMFITNGVMRGAGDTLIPMFITIGVLLLLRFPIGWWLSRYYGTAGIWWGAPISWFVGVVASFIYYRTGRWKNKVVTRPAAFTTPETAEIVGEQMTDPEIVHSENNRL